MPSDDDRGSVPVDGLAKRLTADRCPAPACGATDGEHVCHYAEGHAGLPPKASLKHGCRCGHRWTEEDDRE